MTSISEKSAGPLFFYRQSRLYPDEPLRCDLENVKNSLLGWKSKSATEKALAKLLEGKRISTPYAYFFARRMVN